MPGQVEVSIDWLHTVDLGVGADICGCLFWELISADGIYAGNSRAQRCASLWKALQEWYKSHQVTTKLQGLTENMVKKSKKPPKLAVKGDECRGVQSFLIPCADRLMAGKPGVHSTKVHELCCNFWALVLECTTKTDETCDFQKAQALMVEVFDAYVFLASEEDSVWVVKPKLHLLWHLVHQQMVVQGVPTLTWNYLEESIGGKWAVMSLPRGGRHNKALLASKVLEGIFALQKFR